MLAAFIRWIKLRRTYLKGASLLCVCFCRRGSSLMNGLQPADVLQRWRGNALTYTRSEVLFRWGGCEYVDWDRCGAARPMGRTECRSCAATRLVVTWQISPAVLRWHVANQTWSSIKLIYVKAYSVSRSSCYGICRRVCFICVCQFKWLHVHACAKRHIEFQLRPCQMKTDRCVWWYRMHALKAATFFLHTSISSYAQLFQSSQSGRKNVLLICSYEVFVPLLFNH